jgi:hypothetical protein
MTALETLRSSLSGADLAHLRQDVAAALADGGDLADLAASVADAHPPTKHFPEEFSTEEWEAALRAL